MIDNRAGTIYSALPAKEWAQLNSLIAEYNRLKQSWAENYDKQCKQSSERRATRRELANASEAEKSELRKIKGVQEYTSNILFDIECILSEGLLNCKKQISLLLKDYFEYVVNTQHVDGKFESGVNIASDALNKKYVLDLLPLTESSGILAFTLFTRYNKWIEPLRNDKFNRDVAIKKFAEAEGLTTRKAKSLLNHATSLAFQSFIEVKLEHMIPSFADLQRLKPDSLCKLVEQAKGRILFEIQTKEMAERATERRMRQE